MKSATKTKLEKKQINSNKNKTRIKKQIYSNKTTKPSTLLPPTFPPTLHPSTPPSPFLPHSTNLKAPIETGISSIVGNNPQEVTRFDFCIKRRRQLNFHFSRSVHLLYHLDKQKVNFCIFLLFCFIVCVMLNEIRET